MASPDAGTQLKEGVAPAVAGSDEENADPTKGNLLKLWQQGTEGIATHRTDNLFQSLEERTLTEEEQRIIEQRVALQRKMFEEYEKRERKRKVAELQEVCPDISPEEAEQALEMCDGREDDAAAQLVSDSAFTRRVKVACGLITAPAVAAAPAPRKEPSLSRQSNRHTKATGPRPKLIDPATLGGNVFVGAFRGKGFKPPPKGRPQLKKPGGSRCMEQHQHDEQDEQVQEDEETETEGKEQSEEEEEQGTASQQTVERQQLETIEGIEQQHKQPSALDGAGAEGQQQQGVLLWPSAAGAAGSTGEGFQRYVLVQADTLQAPTDSALRAARRQLGEPSDSRTGAGPAGDAEDPAPASAARSRPLKAVPEEPGEGVPEEGTAMPSATMLAALSKQLAKLDDVKAMALLQRMPTDAARAALLQQLGHVDAARASACRALLAADATAVASDLADADMAEAGVGDKEQQEARVEQPAAAMAMQRGSSMWARAGARRATKRAASAALSDDDEETDVEELEVSSEEEGSSDDDFSVPPPSSRRNGKAYAQQAKARARPSRAAKQAAAAAFVAYAEDSGDEGSDAGMAASSGDNANLVQRRHRRRASKASGGGRRAKPTLASAAVEALEEQAAGPAKDVPANKRQRLEQSDAVPAAANAQSSALGAAEQAPLQQGGRRPITQQDEEHQQRASRRASGDAEANDGDDGRHAAAPAPPRVRAISSTGHTCRGRVKQKSHKAADLVEAGALRAEKGWYNAGYIFPQGFQSRTLFRSSVAIDQLCVHECHIIGKGGQYWPQPTFKVVALDRPDEPLIAKSCTGCWTGILKRINAEIDARRKAGEDLPPPPKTAIAGPEYFGFNQPNIQEAVEALDPNHLCTEYWAGKQDRQRAAAGLPMAASAPARAPRAPRQPSNGGSRRSGGGSKGRTRWHGSSDSDELADGDEDETQFMTNKWSAVSRADRYRKRLQDNGEDTSVLDKDNPLPHFIDPITMSAVVRPAISPLGYVAGLATWKVVLAEKQQCPFTNQPLQFEQLKLLTKTNIHLHRAKIVNGQTGGACGPNQQGHWVG